MELLYISSFLFKQSEGKTFGLPSCSDSFFQKYLNVFSSIRVLGEKIKTYLDDKSLVEMKDEHIKVRIIEANTHPRDFKNDKSIKKALIEEISRAEAVLIKPSSRKGMMAIRIAKRLKKPYMIEMTGDIHNALKQSPNLLKRMYAPFIYSKIKNAIKDCKYGLYVSEKYLQSKYPINGKSCGCSDVILPKSDEGILKSRINKIEKTNFQTDLVQMAFVGFYQGKMKGIDCAIRSLTHLPDNFHLYVLGNGTEDSRKKWLEYATNRKINIERIHFLESLNSSLAVIEWLRTVDMLVLPTHSEGLPRVVLEAMSQAVPCFSTHVCTLPELIDKNCLFKVDDDVGMSSVIKNSIENKETLKTISVSNFEKSKRYDKDLLNEKRTAFLIDFAEHCSLSIR